MYVIVAMCISVHNSTYENFLQGAFQFIILHMKTFCKCHQKRKVGDFEMVILIILNVSSPRFIENFQGAERRLQQIFIPEPKILVVKQTLQS
jgi:hypothetical protein